MVLNFAHDLQQALHNIVFRGQHQEFLVHEKEEARDDKNHSEIFQKYGDYKWQVIDLLNENYALFLEEEFDLYNWLNFNPKDEVAYFLAEAGANAWHYSQYKTPHKYHLWLGEKGFVLGIEQKGAGFNAREVEDKKLKDGEGAAFEFFRNCKSQIFFDNPEEARIVYLEFLF